MNIPSTLSQAELERWMDLEFSRRYMKTADGTICKKCFSAVTPVKGWLHMHDARAGAGVCLPLWLGEGKQKRPRIQQVAIPFCPTCEKIEHTDFCCHV